ncbi:hypothetical protein OG874_26600 [Nocardia sp. NBC_00565]|uniref:hypothetical protein n=1 Tax=Nocardia sp. NBC_00565 TaxID=2975993 RepID=UPI002E816941|nr:hypothetical protein [Nocardia sp. NBC_00565]WUC08351.1 hypothetical protein OG874_26600 [Nocardia sp. NBC_00565]
MTSGAFALLRAAAVALMAGLAVPAGAAGLAGSAAGATGFGATAGAVGLDAWLGGVDGGAVLVKVDGWVTVDSFLVVDFGWAELAVAAFSRGGLVNVTSVGEKDSTSFDPVGFTRRKSLSDRSPISTTLPDLPSGTPTAAAVNHTIGGRPTAMSVAIC